MTLTAHEIAKTLDTTVHVIYRLADEHRFIPLPQSLLLPLGHLDPVDRMTRFGIDEMDAAIFLEDLEAEVREPMTLEEKLEQVSRQLDELRLEHYLFMSRVWERVAPGELPF